MRRRIATLSAVVMVVSTLGVLTSTEPAPAVDVCGGQGTATTSPVWYPPFTGGTGVGTSVKTFVFSFTTGACVHLPTSATAKTITAAGVFLGWCGLSFGVGATGNGALFAWIGVGGALVVTGHLVGVVHVIPDTLNGQNCSPLGPGATRFIVTGVVVLLNCHGTLGSEIKTLIPDPWFELFIHLWIRIPCIPDPLNLD